jgi:hypothetical protein
MLHPDVRIQYNICLSGFKFLLVVNVDTGSNLMTTLQGNLLDHFAHFAVPE